MRTPEEQTQALATLTEKIIESPEMYASLILTMSDQTTNLQTQLAALETKLAEKPTEDIGLMNEILTNAQES
mgnify:CR=1 FL=1